MHRVLITGHQGYIGPHLVRLLKKKNYFVGGVDLGLFLENAWEKLISPDLEVCDDFRNLTSEFLQQFDTVVHLAAISNDSMGELDEQITIKINSKGTVEFASECKKAGVKRFLMSSSCSLYGKSGKSVMTEENKMVPLTAYARSKVYVEHNVSKLADESFCTSFLRNATAYGYSPNLRIDLVANDFLACAISKNEIRIMSDGTPWRPLIHCEDIANAFIYFIEADSEKINNQIVNVGANDQNFQVRDVADIAGDIFPKTKVAYTGEAVSDSRDYKVNFDKLNNMFPNFKLKHDLRSGMFELANKLITYKFDESDYDGDQFFRIRTLKNKLHLINI